MAKELKMIYIISSGEEARDKAMAGLMMAVNMKKKGRVSELRLLFFGPSEKLVAKGGTDIDSLLKDAMDAGIYRSACIAIAEKNNLSENLKNKGISLEPAGEVLAKAMNEGFIPITF